MAITARSAIPLATWEPPWHHDTELLNLQNPLALKSFERLSLVYTNFIPETRKRDPRTQSVGNSDLEKPSIECAVQTIRACCLSTCLFVGYGTMQDSALHG